MNELRLARRNTKRKGAGEGRTGLPLRRSYIRAVIERKPKHKEAIEVGNTRTPEEIEEIRATLAMPTEQRIARLEAAIRELDKEATISGEGTEEMRLSGARLLDQEAMRLTQGRDDDYGQAVRQVVGNTAVTRDDEDDGPTRRLGEVYGNEEEMREAVERRMRENPEEYPNG